jgi:hypothetical protein
VRFTASGDDSGVPVQFRTTIVFDGSTWYLIQSEFAAEDADEMTRGHDQVMSSFQVE